MSYWLLEEKEGLGFFGNYEIFWLFVFIINIFKVGTVRMGFLFN